MRGARPHLAGSPHCPLPAGPPPTLGAQSPPRPGGRGRRGGGGAELARKPGGAPWKPLGAPGPGAHS